jgi:phosphoglycolate phosphatase-like HAD superfamily hydrolase
MNKQNLLFLIDIDGTLISTNGQAPDIMIKAVERTVKRKVEYHIEDFIGRLDPLILRSLLKRAGISESRIEHYVPMVLETYLELLQAELKQESIVVFEGVIEFLNFLKSGNIPYALLTGNVQSGAMIKLKKAGLWDYFSVGAFADDGTTREALVPIAIQRAEIYFGKKFQPNRIWIVGDSLNDIHCARENQCHSLIVETGKSDVEKLKAAQPDLLLHNLVDIYNIFNKIEAYYI